MCDVSSSSQFLSKKLGVDPIMFGYLETIFSLTMLIGGPFFGRFGDLFGARTALTVGLLSAFITYATLAVSNATIFHYCFCPSYSECWCMVSGWLYTDCYIRVFTGVQMVVTALVSVQMLCVNWSQYMWLASIQEQHIDNMIIIRTICSPSGSCYYTSNHCSSVTYSAKNY